MAESLLTILGIDPEADDLLSSDPLATFQCEELTIEILDMVILHTAAVKTSFLEFLKGYSYAPPFHTKSNIVYGVLRSPYGEQLPFFSFVDKQSRQKKGIYETGFIVENRVFECNELWVRQLERGLMADDLYYRKLD